MIKEKFKECIALMERDVAEFEKSLAWPELRRAWMRVLQSGRYQLQ